MGIGDGEAEDPPDNELEILQGERGRSTEYSSLTQAAFLFPGF